MKRYTSIEEVDAALVELEEHERSASANKANNEKHLDAEKLSSRTSSLRVSANGQDLGNGTTENGKLNEVTRDSDNDLDSDSNHEGDDHEDYLDEENQDDVGDSDDDYGEGAHASDEEEEFHVRQKMTRVDPLEEAEFDKELKALLQGSLDSQKLELRARPTLNVVIPMNVFEGHTKDHHGQGLEGESGYETLNEDAEENNEVKVKVLVKRGNKQQTRQMFIPRDYSLVESTKDKETAELKEKQDIKRLVLEYNDREEEELNGLGSQPSGWSQGWGNRFYHRGHILDGHGGRGVPLPRHRYPHGSGGGFYYSRRR